MRHPVKPSSAVKTPLARESSVVPRWPSYLGTSEFVGTSPSGRVTVYVDPSLGQPGLRNAQDLVNDADRVVTANDTIFASVGGAVSVIVSALGGVTDGTGGAFHMGCDYIIGSAIEVCASFGNSTRVSALFEAMLSECSMGGNLCGVSTGEALSRWCAAVIGNNALSDFATAPQWAQDGMPDYVNVTDPTDRSADSTGCGMAFLSWLIGKGYGLNEIAQEIVSLGNSGTLAQLYSKLTSDAITNAWPAFLAAIHKLPNGVTSDHPFGEAFQLTQPALAGPIVGMWAPITMRRPISGPYTGESEIIKAVQRLEQRFESILSDPKLDNFNGNVWVRVTDEPGKQLPLEEMGADQPYFLAGADQRYRLDVSFVVGQPDGGGLVQELRILKGNIASKVTFDVVLDSQTIKLTKDRSSVTFDPRSSSPPLIFDFVVPEDKREHELFVEISQKNRLLQSLLVRLRVGGHPE